VRPSWKQFTIGIAIGIAAWLVWFRDGTLVYFPLMLFMLSCGLMGHAPFILDTGEYAPALVSNAGLSWSPVGAWRRLRDMIVTVAVSVAVFLAGAWLWERVKLRAPSFAAAVTRKEVFLLMLFVLWSIGVVASFRKLRRRAQANASPSQSVSPT
jgi:hypothetical protein